MADLVTMLTIHQSNRFDHAKVSASTTFRELNMDSFEVFDFLMQVENKYGFLFGEEDLFDVETLQDAVDIVNIALRRK